jgi:hypothetical protein
MTKHVSISDRTVFLDLNGVRAVRGLNANQIKDSVDDGSLLWVFDIAAAPSRKDLRFWFPEISDSGSIKGLGLADVIKRILPEHRRWFYGSEISHWFMISIQGAGRLGRKLGGEIKSHTLRVQREPLAGYLEGCWLGSDKNQGVNV